MKHSPKLKKAMAEIKKILNRHDIGAIVLLHEPGFSEYLMNVNPSYSCCSITSEKVSFKLLPEHYDGDIKKRDKVATDTCNMIHLFATVTKDIAINMSNLSMQINSHLNAKHTPIIFTPHIEKKE